MFLRNFMTDLQKISGKNMRKQLLHMLILIVKLKDFIMLLTKFIKALKLSATHMRSPLSSSKLSMEDEINSMMTYIFKAFNGQSYYAPSTTVPTTTLAITEVKIEHEKQTTKEVPKRPIRAVSISTVRPITRLNPELKTIGSLSRIQLIDRTHAFLVPQQTAPSSVRKRTRTELEPEIRIPSLKCNMSLPEGKLTSGDRSLTYLLSTYPAYSSISYLQGLLVVGDRMGLSESVAITY
nr:hypothetical protein [Tanacetum cinerariifolium]